MLGDGMVSLGVAVVTVSARKRNASAKIGWSRRTLALTRSAAGVNSIVPSGVLELHDQLLVGPRDPTQLVDEVHVPRAAAQLAVGGRLEPDLLLHPHDVADGVVLGGAEVLGADATGGGVLAGLEQRRRAEQAPDVIGTERWGREHRPHPGTPAYSPAREEAT